MSIKSADLKTFLNPFLNFKNCCQAETKCDRITQLGIGILKTLGYLLVAPAVIGALLLLGACIYESKCSGKTTKIRSLEGEVVGDEYLGKKGGYLDNQFQQLKKAGYTFTMRETGVSISLKLANASSSESTSYAEDQRHESDVDRYGEIINRLKMGSSTEVDKNFITEKLKGIEENLEAIENKPIQFGYPKIDGVMRYVLADIFWYKFLLKKMG